MRWVPKHFGVHVGRLPGTDCVQVKLGLVRQRFDRQKMTATVDGKLALPRYRWEMSLRFWSNARLNHTDFELVTETHPTIRLDAG
jgi:hypothetical protein